MPKVAVYNMQGNTVGELELNDEIFAAPVNTGLMHQAVVMYLANQRRGTAATKTRAAVSGGGRKPWRQKGTGRARHGSIRSPIWVGGGVTFGPQPRDYRLAMPKKARRQALKSALSSKVAAGSLIVVDELKFDEPKTR
ncbi:MAG: 50S ribosomal protein L4, partial [Firmicutes bacterium]|nr:50S ribosomal protein L4 [Bacillota bacterium]